MRLGWLAVLAGCGGGASTLDAGVDAAQGELAEVHLVGRFDPDGRFGWPGSQIRARFEGSSIGLRLDDTGENQFDVDIDGDVSVLSTTAGQTSRTLVAQGAGEHTVIVTRRSESLFGTTAFGGFSGATLVPSPGPTRRIEMVGDSITCGYGVLGAIATCDFDIDTEAETHAWGALAARELGAVHTAIAYSGKGVYRNYGGDPNEPMPVMFERTFADDPTSQWDFSTPPPDVVVIGLGTNDFSTGDPGQPFVDAYTAFVAQIRGHYPDAWIVLAESPMLGGADHATHAGYLADVAAAAGGEAAKVTTVAIAVQLDADGYGCDYHPNEVTQQKMADALVTKLSGLLGW